MGLGKTKVFLLGLFLLICDEEIFLGQHSIQNFNDVDKHRVIKKKSFFQILRNQKKRYFNKSQKLRISEQTLLQIFF